MIKSFGQPYYSNLNRYCQNDDCPNRLKTFTVKSMFYLGNFVFCSKVCLDEFKIKLVMSREESKDE